MPIPLAGPGQNLPLPQNLFPTLVPNAPVDISTNRLALSPGDSFVLPAGDWLISMGMYMVLQYLDPVTNVWTTSSGTAWNRGMLLVPSDGFTQRIANLTGCVVSASVINGGTNYVQATTTITAIGAFQTGVAVPTLLPIVGGALQFSGTFTSPGAGQCQWCGRYPGGSDRNSWCRRFDCIGHHHQCGGRLSDCPGPGSRAVTI